MWNYEWCGRAGRPARVDYIAYRRPGIDCPWRRPWQVRSRYRLHVDYIKMNDSVRADPGSSLYDGATIIIVTLWSTFDPSECFAGCQWTWSVATLVFSRWLKPPVATDIADKLLGLGLYVGYLYLHAAWSAPIVCSYLQSHARTAASEKSECIPGLIIGLDMSQWHSVLNIDPVTASRVHTGWAKKK